MTQIFSTNSEEESKEVAISIAKNLKAGDMLAITGDLGAGKTLLCRNIIQYLLDKKITVTSPTFNLLQTYDINNSLSVYHYDLYRLKDKNEIFELGINEAFDNICLIEWPEIIQDIISPYAIYIDIIIINENSRKISLKGINS